MNTIASVSPFTKMDYIPVLEVPQRYAQLYRKHLLSKGVLDLQYCVQKHGNGTVTLPIRPSTLPHLDLQALRNSVAQSSSCEILKIQAPQLTKKGRAQSCRKSIIESVQVLFAAKGEKWSKELEDDVPDGYQRHGDLVLFSDRCFSQTIWREMGESENIPLIRSELWLAVAHAVGVKRVAQIKQISQDGFRTPMVTMLLGDTGHVTHTDNHIRYEFDLTKCMFSSGNITEKLRIASFNCTGETVVDLFAGIGYFTLPYLVHAGAAHVHACEWNPDAVAALRRNLNLNKVADRCTVHEGDNRHLSLSDLADRVNLGLLPSSEESWTVACQLLRRDIGGMLHIHHNVTTPLCCEMLEESEPPGTASSGEEKESEPPGTASSGDQESEPPGTASSGDQESEPPGTASSGDQESEPPGTASSGDQESEPPGTASSGDQESEPPGTASSGDQESEPPGTASSGDQEESEPPGTASSGDQESEPPGTASSGDQESEPPGTASSGDQEESEPPGTASSGDQESEPPGTASSGDQESEPPGTALSCKEHKKSVNSSLKSLEDSQAWKAWAHNAASRIAALLKDITNDTWITTIKHIEHVKSYAPHVNHIVLDLECKPAKSSEKSDKSDKK